jgi:hypothetical protein
LDGILGLEKHSAETFWNLPYNREKGYNRWLSQQISGGTSNPMTTVVGRLQLHCSFQIYYILFDVLLYTPKDILAVSLGTSYLGNQRLWYR